MPTMFDRTPLRFILVGGVLLIIGWLLPLLMVMGMVPLSYGLAFLSYALSLGGLAAGLYGVWMYGRSR
ncbi:MAG: hypothetical protein LOD84_00935 [Limnochordales bacterium]